MKPKVAILIDGGFFLKRYSSLYPGADDHSPEIIAKNICKAALKHVPADYELYRIFYYDCFPIGKRVHNPISKRPIDFKTYCAFGHPNYSVTLVLHNPAYVVPE